MISFTSENEFFKGKAETSFSVMRFSLELTQHIIPPKGCQFIRRYGLYASRTKRQIAGQAACAPACSPGVEEGTTAGF